jgi:hypothetical protein
VQTGARGDHARVLLREGDDEQPFALEFLRGLSEAPGVVDELADVVAAGERTNVVHGLEDAGGCD